MSQITKPISELIKQKTTTIDTDEPKKRSREDWRKAKELEEARKAGNAPAAVDEEGRDINPHIPQYISNAPWYVTSEGPTLKHQRPQKDLKRDIAKMNDYYERGQKTSVATHFRKGACENCGAMTHKLKDCVERPRKILAKFSGEYFAPDEAVLPDMKLDYDGKRDRWNGFDPSMYSQVLDEYAKVEEAKRQLKEEKLNKQDKLKIKKESIKDNKSKDLDKTEDDNSENVIDGEDKGEENEEDSEETKQVDSDTDDDEDDKYADHIDMPGTKVDSKQRITVRNLRIREDVAKYLRNLDPDSAYYDPKTRSMRDNPYKTYGKTPEELPYAGENFNRFTGDTNKVAEAQLFAWQAHEKGIDVHLQAEPTKAELVHKDFEVKKEEFKSGIKQSILDKYGDCSAGSSLPF